MKAIALVLLLFTCLLAVTYAASSRIVINGRCIGCIGPGGVPLEESHVGNLEPIELSKPTTKPQVSKSGTFNGRWPGGMPLDESPVEILEPIELSKPITKPQTSKSGAVTQTLTSGAVTLGLIYYSIGFMLRNFHH